MAKQAGITVKKIPDRIIDGTYVFFDEYEERCTIQFSVTDRKGFADFKGMLKDSGATVFYCRETAGNVVWDFVGQRKQNGNVWYAVKRFPNGQVRRIRLGTLNDLQYPDLQLMALKIQQERMDIVTVDKSVVRVSTER